MPVSLAAMGDFARINNAGGKGVYQLGGANHDVVQSGGTFKDWNIFRRIGRDTAANNAARTSLLRHLANAFDLKGDKYFTEKGGFKNELLDALDEKLSLDGKPVLNRSRFKLDKDGRVVSGRPLTERRITKIMQAVAQQAGEGEKYMNSVITLDAAIADIAAEKAPTLEALQQLAKQAKIPKPTTMLSKVDALIFSKVCEVMFKEFRPEYETDNFDASFDDPFKDLARNEQVVCNGKVWSSKDFHSNGTLDEAAKKSLESYKTVVLEAFDDNKNLLRLFNTISSQRSVMAFLMASTPEHPVSQSMLSRQDALPMSMTADNAAIQRFSVERQDDGKYRVKMDVGAAQTQRGGIIDPDDPNFFLNPKKSVVLVHMELVLEETNEDAADRLPIKWGGTVNESNMTLHVDHDKTAYAWAMAPDKTKRK